MWLPAGGVETAIRSHRDRTFSITIDGRKLWIKQPRDWPTPLWCTLHHAAASLLGLRLFRPAAVSLGAAGLREEARRLRALRARSWPVPEVVEVCDEWLVLTDNGETLAARLPRSQSDGDRLDLLAGALAFLQALHAGGGWHGAAQVRNICLGENGFGLIDFEDDIEAAMPLASRQARDVLQLVLSGARYFSDSSSTITDLLARAYQGADRDVRAELASVGRIFKVARKVLHPVRSRVGRDGKAIYAVASAYGEVFNTESSANIGFEHT
jgi:tRNA A-37 threonylcarbamoyl transferase component Bud32